MHVISAVKLGNGMDNNTNCVDIGADLPVILRVAPEPAQQFRIERKLMHNEHAGVPYPASTAPLMPRTLTADFTSEVIGRDYLFQTMPDGVPAPEGLSAYPERSGGAFFRQMVEDDREQHSRGARR